MTQDNHPGEGETQPEAASPARALTPAAQRALAEAAERRARDEDMRRGERPEEVNGRDGPEPTRFGDWERNGIVSDF